MEIWSLCPTVTISMVNLSRALQDNSHYKIEGTYCSVSQIRGTWTRYTKDGGIYFTIMLYEKNNC